MAKTYPRLDKLYPTKPTKSKPKPKVIIRTKTITKVKTKPGQPTKAHITAAVARVEGRRKLNKYDEAIITWRIDVAEEPINKLADEYGITHRHVVKVAARTRALNLIRMVTVPECVALGIDHSHQGGRANALEGVDLASLSFNDPNPEEVTRRHLYDASKMTPAEIRMSLVLVRLGLMTQEEVQTKYDISAPTWRDFKALYSPHGRVLRFNDGTYTRVGDKVARLSSFRRTASNPVKHQNRKLDPETQEIAERELDALEDIANARRQ